MEFRVGTQYTIAPIWASPSCDNDETKTGLRLISYALFLSRSLGMMVILPSGSRMALRTVSLNER